MRGFPKAIIEPLKPVGWLSPIRVEETKYRSEQVVLFSFGVKYIYLWQQLQA